MEHLKGSALFVLLLCLSISFGEKVRYDNYKVYRVVPHTQHEADVLRTLEKGNEVSFWKEVTRPGRPVDIMVSPEKAKALELLMRRQRLDNQVYVENVQSLIDTENPETKGSKQVDWTVYNTYDEIVQWLQEVAQQYPEVASTVSLGTSYEGRDLAALKLSTGGTNKPAIFIDGAHHAREWITSATITWIINELLTSTDPEVQSLIQDFDWYFEPIVNVDGYVFTNTDDRLWRKTRSPNDSPVGCVGTDPNRNYDYQWMTGGSSSSPCSDTYAGASPFSEQEAQAVADFLTSISNDLVFYLSLHSYGQYIMFPYGNDFTHYEFYDEYMRVGGIAAEAIAQRYNTQYTYGTVIDVLYETSGISIDWAKGVLDTDWSYTFELRDQGRYGFILPANQIIPTAEETFDGIIAMAREFSKKLHK